MVSSGIPCRHLLAVLLVWATSALGAAYAQELPQRPKPRTVGKIEMTGVLKYFQLGIGGATTGASIELDKRPLSLRVDHEELKELATKYHEQRVWIEGFLTIESQFEEASGKYVEVWAVRVEHMRSPRTKETVNAAKVDVQGRVVNKTVQFGLGTGPTWSLDSADTNLMGELTSVVVRELRLVGTLAHDRKRDDWQLVVTGIQPPTRSRE